MSVGRSGPPGSGDPKRIAFVIDAVYPFNKGGRERRLWEITRRSARDGHDVRVYTMKSWSDPRTIELDGVSLHALCRFHPLYRGTRRSKTQALLFGFATLKLLTERLDMLDVDRIPRPAPQASVRTSPLQPGPISGVQVSGAAIESAPIKGVRSLTSHRTTVSIGCTTKDTLV